MPNPGQSANARYLPSLLAICCGAIGCASLHAAYRPLEVPEYWVFRQPTAAVSADTGEPLGQFQPGVRVDVIAEHWQQGQWQVAFRRFGQPDLNALIDIPNLANEYPERLQRANSLLQAFPLLHIIIQSPDPWPESPAALAEQVFPGGWNTEDASETILTARNPGTDARAWDLQPLSASVDYGFTDRPRLVIEFWNKGDAHRTRLRPAPARDTLRDNLIALESAFVTWRGDQERRGDSPGITALRRDAEHFFLPNDLQATLRYRAGEYLLLEMTSFRRNQLNQATGYNPETFAKTLRTKVKTHPDGYRYISGIPMISQGEKGYCAAATLARVINFYGYPVDMHAIAELAKTEGETGTSLDNILSAMQRICNSTPFRMHEVRGNRRSDILQIIDRGVPLIWLIPGHMRLLIGVNPEGGIVYSDSWGPGHEFKTMPWSEFVNLNRGLYRIEP